MVRTIISVSIIEMQKSTSMIFHAFKATFIKGLSIKTKIELKLHLQSLMYILRK